MLCTEDVTGGCPKRTLDVNLQLFPLGLLQDGFRLDDGDGGVVWRLFVSNWECPEVCYPMLLFPPCLIIQRGAEGIITIPPGQ